MKQSSKTICLSLALCAAAFCQAPIQFEVVSVKPSATGERGIPGQTGGPGTPDPGIFRATRYPMIAFLIQAFGVSQMDISGPPWIGQAAYDINATVPPGATKDQMGLMLQHLLVERFGLVFHREMRDVPAFELTIAKGGHKLRETKDPNLPFNRPGGPPTTVDRDGYPVLPAGVAGSSGHVTDGVLRETAIAVPVSIVARMLRFELGTPNSPARIIDKTGLTGKYDYRWEYQPLRQAASSADFSGPPLLDALQKQLGLKVEKTTIQVEMLVIDKIERVPTEN